MWKPPINFITLHYAYILSLGIIGLIVIYPYGNMPVIDAYFFGVSASTESGLNTIDVKALKLYQQLVVYFIPVVTQLGFINIIVVVVRLYWFEKRLKKIAPTLLRPGPRVLCRTDEGDLEANRNLEKNITGTSLAYASGVASVEGSKGIDPSQEPSATGKKTVDAEVSTADDEEDAHGVVPHIAFENAPHPRSEQKALYVPSPREREQGHRVREVDDEDMLSNGDDDVITKARNSTAGPSEFRRRRSDGRSIAGGTSIEHVASSMFVLGAKPNPSRARSRRSSVSQAPDMPYLSSQATIGRNSQFKNLTKEDRELLGGLEYRALKLLLKIVVGYFFGLHLFGAIVLVGWIHTCNPKYRVVLVSHGQDKTWWGLYSAQTMVNNLGFTLTPDSMVSFQDAQWPMIFMSFLAYAGNTCYPCLLRFVIWAAYKLTPRNSSVKDPLNFLLQHPRRCYTLLFPSRPTWILFGFLFALNFIDIVLIIVLDLNNPTVSHLPGGPRLAAAIFQAASSRHTGTSSFNLAAVHPGVQFSLLVMMYISVFPIAIAVRASNTYEEKSLGVYLPDADVDEHRGSSYVMQHIQNQLSFDLWYIFLGIFCISIAEASKISDNADPAFAIFPIFFEVVSAYGNVGLSLGHPSNLTSLSGHFRPFSKLVICAMMIRGRHRVLPYQLDRAILLPGERDGEDEDEDSQPTRLSETQVGDAHKMKRFHTQ